MTLGTTKPRGADGHDYNRRVGARIRARRKKAAIPPDEVAQQLGVSAAQLRRYETGDTGTDPAILARLAQILGCKAADFLEGLEGR